MPRMSVTSRLAAAALATALAGGATLATAAPASADGVTPAQLTAAGWTCIQPHLAPALLLCAPPGAGLPPLPWTPGFADRQPSYEFLVFDFATSAFLGTEHLLGPTSTSRGSHRARNSPAASTSTTRATTSGSATGSASTRPPDRRQRSPERITNRAGGGSRRPPADSKPADSAVRQHLQPTRTAICCTRSPFCPALMAQNNHSSAAWSNSGGDRVATH
jgi:hypothetical protein